MARSIRKSHLPLYNHPRASLVRTASIALRITSDCTVHIVGEFISRSSRTLARAAKNSVKGAGNSGHRRDVRLAPTEHLH